MGAFIEKIQEAVRCATGHYTGGKMMYAISLYLTSEEVEKLGRLTKSQEKEETK